MRKLMMAAVVMMMTVGVAQAAADWDYVADCYFNPHQFDENPSEENARWYTCYCLTQEAAQQAMKATEDVTAASYYTWLGENYFANKQATIDAGQLVNTYFQVYAGRYNFAEGNNYADDYLYGVIGVVFYEREGVRAYATIDGNIETYFLLDEDSTAWKTVTVPEPTSGLLLLLGVAGLALKRKRT